MSNVPVLEVVPDEGDHKLAEALRKRGWEGIHTSDTVSVMTTFFAEDGKVIGKVVYDNEKSKKVLITLCAEPTKRR